MKLWLTAQEIADLGLPGLPDTKRGVAALAERQGWAERKPHCRPRRGVGGGSEYHLDLLPPEARQAYVGRLCAEAVPFAFAEAAEAEPAAAALRDDAAEARDARLAVLAAAESFRLQASLPQHHADLRFVEEFRAGRVTLPGWVTGQIRKLSQRTIARWRAEAKAGRTAALAVDRGVGRRGSSILDVAEDGQVRVYALALITHQPHLSADHVRALLKVRFGESLNINGKPAPLPDVRRVREALARWRASNRVILTAMTNPDGFKSRFRATGSNSDSGIRRPNQLWQIDASPVDALCVDGRHSVYVAIDVYTRRIVLYVSRTPRAQAVGLMLRRAILAWGVPERIKTDNGSDFTAKAIERLLAHLGIERELSPAFTPEAKAIVERAIGTFQRDFTPLLPGFIGHSVADRKVIEARRAFAQRLGDNDDAKAFCVDLKGAELQALCDRWAADRYQARPHAGLDGQTPFAVAAAYTGTLRRLEDARALDILLADVAGRDGVRTVGKQGVRIDGSLYLAPGILQDAQVLVRMDPADLGRAWLFDIEGRAYLGEAICPELAGIDPVRAVTEAKAAQRDLIASRTAAIRSEARKIKPRDMVEAILAQDAKGSGTLVAFPRATALHSTPELDAAAQVGQPAAPPVPSSVDDALRAEIEADIAGVPITGNVEPLRLRETPQMRFRRALALQARIAAGETIPTDEALWLGGYQAGPEFRSFADTYEDFGEAALK